MGPKNWVWCTRKQAIMDPWIQLISCRAMLILIGQDVLTAIGLHWGMCSCLMDLNGAAVSWKSKRQSVVALSKVSSAEADCVATSAMVQEWLRQLWFRTSRIF
jgi:hypothetical protein